METKILNIIIVTLLFITGFSSCSNDEPESIPNYPSHRDGIFSGNQLTFTLDGIEVSSVTSVTLNSTLKDANVSPDNGKDGNIVASNPTYNTTIKIVGFPVKGETSTFSTISDLMGFEGGTRIDNMDYGYVGEFTGDPLNHHDNQGLILNFWTIK